MNRDGVTPEAWRMLGVGGASQEGDVRDRVSNAGESGLGRWALGWRRGIAGVVAFAAVVAGARAQGATGESGLNKVLTATPTAPEKRPSAVPGSRESPGASGQAAAADAGAKAVPTASEPKTERLPLGPAGQAQRGGAATGAGTERKAWTMPRVSGPVLALSAVLGLILILAGLARLAARGRASTSLRAEFGAGGRSPAGLLEVIGRYPIARGATLVLLRLDRRIVLLSMSSGLRGGTSFSTLCEVSDPEEVASILVHARDAEGDSMAERFRSLLAKSDERLSPARGEAKALARANRPVARSSAIEVKPSDNAAAALAQRLAAARSAAGMPAIGGGAARAGARGASPRLKDVSA